MLSPQKICLFEATASVSNKDQNGIKLPKPENRKLESGNGSANTHYVNRVTGHLKVEIRKKFRVGIFNVPHPPEEDGAMDEAVLAEVDDAGAEVRISEDVTLLDVVKRVGVGRGCVTFAHRKVAAGTANCFAIV